MRIAINGCGVAGPALAWWLREFGFELVLFESAPELRTGGYIVEFWGTGYDVAERGRLPRARHAGSAPGGRKRRRGTTPLLIWIDPSRFSKPGSWILSLEVLGRDASDALRTVDHSDIRGLGTT